MWRKWRQSNLAVVECAMLDSYALALTVDNDVNRPDSFVLWIEHLFFKRKSEWNYISTRIKYKPASICCILYVYQKVEALKMRIEFVIDTDCRVFKKWNVWRPYRDICIVCVWWVMSKF